MDNVLLHLFLESFTFLKPFYLANQIQFLSCSSFSSSSYCASRYASGVVAVDKRANPARQHLHDAHDNVINHAFDQTTSNKQSAQRIMTQQHIVCASAPVCWIFFVFGRLFSTQDNCLRDWHHDCARILKTFWLVPFLVTPVLATTPREWICLCW